MDKKCQCKNPTCAKCLSVNCRDDNCATHSIGLKIKAREKILSSFKTTEKRAEAIRKEILRLKNKTMANDKTHRGNTSQFYAAAEICRRGLVAVVTMGNCPNTDILCSNKEGMKFAHIQIKTFRPRDKNCSIGMKAEKNYGDNFFWILCGIPEPNDKDQTFKYFIIPSKEMSRNVRESFELWAKTPGKKGQIRSEENKFRSVALPPRKDLNGWDISSYLNRWKLIEDKLK